MTFLGFCFFGLLFILTTRDFKRGLDLFAIIIAAFFAGLSLTCLFYFFSIKTITLKVDCLEISRIGFPFKQTYLFDDITRISQIKKEISAVYGVSWRTRYIYTDIITTLRFSDNRTIELNSVGELDFNNFHDSYLKIKRREGKIKQKKIGIALYLIDNLDGIFWIILLTILTTGLLYSVLMMKNEALAITAPCRHCGFAV